MRNFVIPAMAVALITGGAAAQTVFVTPTPELGQCRSYTNPDEQTRCLNRLYAGLSSTTVPATTAVPATTGVPATSGTRALGGDSAVGNAGGAGVGVGSSTGTAPGGGMGTRGSGNQG